MIVDIRTGEDVTVKCPNELVAQMCALDALALAAYGRQLDWQVARLDVTHWEADAKFNLTEIFLEWRA